MKSSELIENLKIGGNSMGRYCGNCEYLTLTEEQQEILRIEHRKNGTYLKGKENFHYCKKYNERVLHNGEHPLLPKLEICISDIE